MRTYKTKNFHRWAVKEHVTDEALVTAAHEIETGLVDAELGKHVIKKRVPLPGHGKRGGARTLIAFSYEGIAFFMYGFAKNERSNIRADELAALRRLATELLSLTDSGLEKALQAGALIEVKNHG